MLKIGRDERHWAGHVPWLSESYHSSFILMCGSHPWESFPLAEVKLLTYVIALHVYCNRSQGTGNGNPLEIAFGPWYTTEKRIKKKAVLYTTSLKAESVHFLHFNTVRQSCGRSRKSYVQDAAVCRILRTDCSNCRKSTVSGFPEEKNKWSDFPGTVARNGVL